MRSTRALRRLCASLLVPLLAACGGATSSASVTGTLGGVDFSQVVFRENTSISSSGPDGCPGGGGVYAGINILLSANDGLCAAFVSGQATRNNTWVELWVLEPGANRPIAPGTYLVGTNNDAAGNQYQAIISYERDDAACNPLNSSTAVSGSITIDTIRGSALTGSFIAVDDAGTLRGTFSTSPCDAPAALGCPGGAQTCQ